MAGRVASWLARATPTDSQLVAEADALPGLAEDSGRTPPTPTDSMDLDDDIPDVGTRAACRQGMDGSSRTCTCGRPIHEACLRTHKDQQGPMAGCPSRGPE
eukprot:15433382-Alexandrium_andersonii.AAC.1